MLIVRSPVRISFGGGGTEPLPAYYQQYGGAVLSTTINKYFYTVLGTRSDQSIQIISSDLRICEAWSDFAALRMQDGGLEIPVAVLNDFGARSVCGSISRLRDSARDRARIICQRFVNV